MSGEIYKYREGYKNIGGDYKYREGYKYRGIYKCRGRFINTARDVYMRRGVLQVE